MAQQGKKKTKENGGVLFFDFDGTIAESFGGVMEIFNEVAEEYDYQKITEKDIASLRKLSSHDIIKRVAVPKWKLPMIIYRARKIFNRRLPSIPMVFGMKETLIELKSRNYFLGILTSNSEKNVKDFLVRQKVDAFDAIFSENSLLGKDKALKKIVRDYGWDMDKVFYIGDETRDMEAAKKSGAASVAVCWGFNTEKILREYGPDHVVRKPKGLLKIF